MIATVDIMEVIDQSERLGKLIVQSEIAQHYRHCKHKLVNDPSAQRLIQRFTEVKDKYEEVQRFGKYHPDFKQISTEMRQIKRNLDLHDTIAEFKQAETGLESLLNEVSAIIAREVSPSIKVPTGNPFFDNRGCGGGCGAGGPCGCG